MDGESKIYVGVASLWQKKLHSESLELSAETTLLDAVAAFFDRVGCPVDPERVSAYTTHGLGSKGGGCLGEDDCGRALKVGKRLGLLKTVGDADFNFPTSPPQAGEKLVVHIVLDIPERSLCEEYFARGLEVLLAVGLLLFAVYQPMLLLYGGSGARGNAADVPKAENAGGSLLAVRVDFALASCRVLHSVLKFAPPKRGGIREPAEAVISVFAAVLVSIHELNHGLTWTVVGMVLVEAAYYAVHPLCELLPKLRPAADGAPPAADEHATTLTRLRAGLAVVGLLLKAVDASLRHEHPVQTLVTALYRCLPRATPHLAAEPVRCGR